MLRSADESAVEGLGRGLRARFRAISDRPDGGRKNSASGATFRDQATSNERHLPVVPVSTSTASASVVRFDPRRRAVDDLITKAQAGDKSAFGELYRVNVGRVYALCVRLTQDPARAEQLTQDAFVRAWEKLDLYRGDAAFSTWLHRLTVNVALAARRSDDRRRVRETASVDTTDRASAPHQRRDAGIDLERALAALPERCRTVFVLHELEGLRHEEIAELLGLAVGTSKSQLHRARNLLKEALA